MSTFNVEKDTELLDPFQRHMFLNPSTGRLIQIYGMKHVSYQDDFDRVNASVVNDVSRGYTVHVEGVRDNPEWMRGLAEFYKALAENFNQSLQTYEGFKYEVHDASFPELPLINRIFMRVMVGVMNWILTKTTIDQIFPGGVESMDKSIKKKSIFGDFTTFMLSGKRERIAVKAAVEAEGNISMIWGSVHIPSFINRFRKMGFEYVASEKV